MSSLCAAFARCLALAPALAIAPLRIGGRRRQGCGAQGGKGRNESRFHVEAPCAPSRAHPRRRQSERARLNVG